MIHPKPLTPGKNRLLGALRRATTMIVTMATLDATLLTAKIRLPSKSFLQQP